jgi:hypothetical protein
VEHREMLAAKRLQDATRRFNGWLQSGDIVAQHFSETSGQDEVSLHVDDEQGSTGGLETEFVRQSFYR